MKMTYQAQLQALLWLQQELPQGLTSREMRLVLARHIERLHKSLDGVERAERVENGSQDGTEGVSHG